jgi:ubiquinone/menaquinone biosynthesis C-methylase UbiE
MSKPINSVDSFQPTAWRVDYDSIAPSYDQRTEKGYLLGITQALQSLARQVKARRILDLGCGTGRSLFGLANSLEPSPVCYGLDFSAGMLTQAHRFDSTYHLVRASAPLPPFAPSNFELIFCVHAFHHFPDQAQVVRSAYALLQPGGALAIVNIDPHDSDDEWYAYDYFEGVYETDLARFPTVAEQETMLRQAGFQQVSSPIVQLIENDMIGETVFDNYFLRKEACSQFILLTEEAYQAGLDRMHAAVAQAKAKDEQIVFQTRHKDRMCHGFKPT